MYYYTIDRCFLDHRHLVRSIIIICIDVWKQILQTSSSLSLFLAIHVPNLLLFLTNLNKSLGSILLPMFVRNQPFLVKHYPFISRFEDNEMYNQILQHNCILYIISWKSSQVPTLENLCFSNLAIFLHRTFKNTTILWVDC
jgi:hypothetical protein